MAEKYRFFDAVLQEDGVTYDREYDAQEFTDYFKALVTTGIMKGAGNQLAVTANGSNMITKVDTGIAFLLGRYYENDSFKELTHDTETLGNSRIDRIVIRMDLSTEARYVKSFIKKGVPSPNPVPPTLTQTNNIYEISLAQVKIVGGQTFIAANAVTDERGIDVVCPWAGSNILPSFDDNALAEHINNKKIHVSKAEIINATLINGWVGVYGGVYYYKDGFDIVHFWGRVTNGSSNILQMPVGYRPSTQKDFSGFGLQINPTTGAISVYNNFTRVSSNGNISLGLSSVSGYQYLISGSYEASN